MLLLRLQLPPPALGRPDFRLQVVDDEQRVVSGEAQQPWELYASSLYTQARLLQILRLSCKCSTTLALPFEGSEAKHFSEAPNW